MIEDPTGDFYIIHPLENFFNRNKLTGKFENPNLKNLTYFRKFINNLFKLRLIVIEDQTLIKTKIYDIYEELTNSIKNVIPSTEINYHNLITMILGERYNKLEEVLWSNIIISDSSIEKLSRKYSNKSGREFSDNRMLIETFGDNNSDLTVYTNIFNKLKLILAKLEIISGKDKSLLSENDLNCLKNYENRNKKQIDLLRFYKNTDKLDKSKIEIWCDENGLDFSEIDNVLMKYLSYHKIVYIIKVFVEKYKNYIPFFNLNSLDFIYISSYADIVLSNTDNKQDYNKSVLDQFSIVTGNKITGLLKEKKLGKTTAPVISLKHLINFNYELYVPAIIPALINPLEKNLLEWNLIYILYKIITPSMIEKYLLPETEKDKDINKKNKIYNNQLLGLFRLLRTKV